MDGKSRKGEIRSAAATVLSPAVKALFLKIPKTEIA